MTKNALFIDYEYCTGCHSCEIACRNELSLPIDGFGIKVLEDNPRTNPDGKWHWDYIAYPTELCDMCEKRVGEGKLPACVQRCQGQQGGRFPRLATHPRGAAPLPAAPLPRTHSAEREGRGVPRRPRPCLCFRRVHRSNIPDRRHGSR